MVEGVLPGSTTTVFNDDLFFYLQAGRCEGVLSVGRSSDIDAGRRLISSGADLTDRADELADLSSDLAGI